MKYCMNCGTPLEDNDMFCPGCGTRQDNIADESPEVNTDDAAGNISEADTEPASEPVFEADAADTDSYVFVDDKSDAGKKKPLGKGLKIALIVIAAVVVLAGAAFAFISGRPKVILAKALENTAADIKEIPFISYLGKVGEGGSIGAEVDLQEVLENFGIDLDGALAVTEYYDMENESVAVTGEFKIHDTTAADASIWVCPDAVIVGSDVLLGKEAYGIGIKDLPENLKHSDLKDYVPDYIVDAIENADERIFSDPEGCNQIISDYSKAVVQYLGEEILKSAEFKKSSEKIDFADSSVKATVITMTIDEDIFKEAMKNTLDYAEKDEKFDEARDLIASALGLTASISDGIETDGEDIMDDSFDEIEDSIDDIDDIDMEIRFYVYQKRVVRIEIEDSESDMELCITCGPDPSNPELTEFTVNDDYTDEEIGWEVETDTDSEYEARLYSNNEDIDISLDKKAGEYSVEMKNAFTFEGTYEKSDKEISIVVEKEEIDGEEYEIDTTVDIKTKDSFPKVPDYIDILTLDEEELEDIVDDIMDNVEDIADEIGY